MPTGLDLEPVAWHMLTLTTPDMSRPPAGTAIPIEGLTTEEGTNFPWLRSRLARPRAPQGSFTATCG
ncbi:hypothetical protein GCM10010305_03680 [Streptomyces termitum]|uniref:Uncharacterized protein n=1 Tax=Streptomyces termitum TaxID=67368 RepID=A0A918W2I5_9ACTN|nr:hypothetical protein GCM10010305_03680 [Streptomyces termitum]